MNAGLPTALTPRLRGVIHAYAFYVAIVGGVALIIAAQGSRERVGAAIYTFGLAGMLGASALYHRVCAAWPPARRIWLRRIDHAMIAVLCAATATPIALIALDGALATILLVAVWTGAVGAIAIALFWPEAPRGLRAGVYLALGWAGVAAMPALADHAVAALVLLAAGGLLYSAGAIIYAFRRPDPWPRTFGFHEVFHTLVVAAAALHFVAVGIVVL